MVGVAQYRSMVAFPGETALRGKRVEAEGLSLAMGRLGSGGGGSSFSRQREQREERQRAWAALRVEIEAMEEPERWDGLA